MRWNDQQRMRAVPFFLAGLFAVAVMATGSIAGCGSSSSSSSSSSGPATALPLNTVQDAAKANFVYDKVLGKAGVAAQFTALSKTTFKATAGLLAQQYALAGFTGPTAGVWAGTGANGETIKLTFYRKASPIINSTLITDDITNPALYQPGGPLFDIWNGIMGAGAGMDTTKLSMKIDIIASFTDATGVCRTVNSNMTTGLIDYASGANATFKLSGSGTATLSNGSVVSLDTMDISATNNGGTIAGKTTTTVPTTGGNFQIVCEFDEKGCKQNKVYDAQSNLIGTVGPKSSGSSELVYVDGATGNVTTIATR